MIRLIVVLCIALCLSAHADLYTEIHGDGVHTTGQQQTAEKKLQALHDEFERGGLTAMAERTDKALNGLFWVAIRNLKKHGHYSTAKKMEREWNEQRGKLYTFMRAGRDIGDFEPISLWLAAAYEVLEYTLGYEICRALRLSDIKTFNYTIPVVFSPCKHGFLEFEMHFVHDAKYRGLAPVVSYWVSVITCSVATYGAGYFFICSPIGMLVELGMDRWAAPWLAPKIYNLACE